MKAYSLVTSAVAVALLSGCGSTPPPSAEDQAFINQMRGALLAKVQGAQVLAPAQQMYQQQPQPQPIAEPVITESELLAKKQTIDASGGPAIFFREKDGIKINGQMFNDFEGQVAEFGGNRLTGEFTYAVKNFDGSFSLKYFKAGSTEGPVKIAKVLKQGSNFEVTTVTGKKMPGSSVIPTSDGFIVGRPGSAFRYVIGSDNVKSISMLDNYHIAKYQNGDAASTGYILLEKDEKPESNKVAGLFDSFSELGNSLGLNQADDYVLVNLNDSSTVPLDVTLGGKDVAKHSGCRRQNDYVNKCDNVEFEEALYTNLGLRNNSHYYWAINWVQTSSGPMAIYRTTTKVKIVDINNGRVHTAFSRTLGVNHFTVHEKEDGTVALEAKLGFSSDRIENLEEFIQSNTVDIEPMQQLQTP